MTRGADLGDENHATFSKSQRAIKRGVEFRGEKRRERKVRREGADMATYREKTKKKRGG